MSHDCHNDKCRRDRRGIFIPSVITNTKDIPNICIEMNNKWNKRGDLDIDGIRQDGRDFAKWCYTSVSGIFMLGFRDEYERLKGELK